MSERFVVTGALGCIGSWVVRQLIAEDASVVALDHGGSDHRLRQVLDEGALAAVTHVDCDIADLAALERTLREHRVTHVVHLAALQIPFCRADPSLGARVNVVGSVNVFEAVRRLGGIAGPIAFASSVAAYEPAELDGAEPAGSHHASTLYGVYKTANEGTASVYWADEAIASVGLRPYVVYGVGRDQGLTASPTFAMLAAAGGRPSTISYRGTSHLQLAEDVAAAFVAAARSSFRGADVFNLGGAVVDMAAVVAAIERAAPESRGLITVAGSPLPFPPEVDHGRFGREVAPEQTTPLDEGVRRTVDAFRDLVARGVLDVPAGAVP